MSEAAALSLLILTEDSGADAFATVAAMTHSILALVDPDHDPTRIRMEPLNDERLRVIVGSVWKSERPEDRRLVVDLCGRIASTLAQRERAGFVVFHIDGDRSWSERASSENVAKFNKLIVDRVGELLRDTRAHRKKGQKPKAAINRLLLLLPFYSIEAWLFQNTEEATRICQSHYAGRDVELFLQWAADRTLLDEIVRPKGAQTCCLQAKHNLALAEADYPAAAVDAAKRSFTETVARFRRCSHLLEALATTHP